MPNLRYFFLACIATCVLIYFKLLWSTSTFGTVLDEYASASPSSSGFRDRYTPISDVGTEYLTNGVKVYLNAANSLEPITDKVTTHSYQVMYGKFLMPFYYQKPSMKMLEIGMGCDMTYGPGASVALHDKLFPRAEKWEGEYDGECVKQMQEKGFLDGMNVLVGDQGNDTVLDGWIAQSGGNFDVVIDDGGHKNCQIWHTFLKLWPQLQPGGLYFIEDMQVAKEEHYRGGNTTTCTSDLIVPDYMKEIVDHLIYSASCKDCPYVPYKSEMEYIFCQMDACLIGKRHADDPWLLDTMTRRNTTTA